MSTNTAGNLTLGDLKFLRFYQIIEKAGKISEPDLREQMYKLSGENKVDLHGCSIQGGGTNYPLDDMIGVSIGLTKVEEKGVTYFSLHNGGKRLLDELKEKSKDLSECYRVPEFDN
jgi:hypothetical protein